MTSSVIRVAVAQHRCVADRDANLTASLDAIREAATRGAELVLLPELHTSLYFCQVQDPNNFDLAEPLDGPTSQALAKVAADCKITVIGSIFERRGAGVYHNTAVVFDDTGKSVGHYRKMHIPDDPGFNEKYYFAPGDQGFQPIATRHGRIGLLVCWDQWYPEAARIMALNQADFLVYPSAIGWDPGDDESEKARQQDAWTTVMRGHAVANALPVVASNRVGHEKDPSNRSAGIDFWGSSFICGPQGELLAKAGADAEIIIANIEPSRTEQVRRVWPFLRDRRIDSYEAITGRISDLDD